MAESEDRAVGDYVLRELLGRGSTGRVYRAEDRRDGSVHAVKVLREDLLDDPTATARFEREAQSLSAVDDPAVVRVQELVTDGSELAIVMELVTGPNLRRYLSERGILAPSVACSIAAQVCRGLAAAHAAHMVHRDLKPENIMVETTGEGTRARVTDFGVARLTYGGSKSRTSQLVGTPDYMAPEMAEAGGTTAAVDVYAVGVLLFELVVGWRPFRGETPMAVLRQHEYAPRRQPPGFPDEIWRLVRDALSPNPADRPAAAALASELDRVALELMNASPLSVTTPPPPEPISAANTALTQPRTSRQEPLQATPRRATSAAKAVAILLAFALLGWAAIALAAPRLTPDTQVQANESQASSPTEDASPTSTSASPSPTKSSRPKPTKGGDGTASPTSGGPGGGVLPPSPTFQDLTTPTGSGVPTRSATTSPSPDPPPPPRRPRSGPAVVEAVLDSGDPRGSYQRLSAEEQRRYLTELNPTGYASRITQPQNTRDNLEDDAAAERGERCWERIATLTATSATGRRLYEYWVHGYWCVSKRSGVVTSKNTFAGGGQALTRGWSKAGREPVLGSKNLVQRATVHADVGFQLAGPDLSRSGYVCMVGSSSGRAVALPNCG